MISAVIRIETIKKLPANTPAMMTVLYPRSCPGIALSLLNWKESSSYHFTGKTLNKPKPPAHL
jgi:hypothetical protein